MQNLIQKLNTLKTKTLNPKLLGNVNPKSQNKNPKPFKKNEPYTNKS